jgi:cbb3-type cytochrome oxidase subunit 3
MKLADVVSGAGLAGYAEIALLLFFLVFVVVGIRVLFSARGTMERAAHMPLDDDVVSPPSLRTSATDHGN